MQPVNDNIVNRDVTAAEFSDRGKYFLAGIILLTALPVAHGPLRHHRSLTGQAAVTGDDLVGSLAVYEIIVGHILHLAPP